jgi:iron(III) transport system permease protein
MAGAVIESVPAVNLSFVHWRHGVGGVVLWGSVALLVLYPLLMVVAAMFAPAFPDSQPLTLAQLTSDRLLSAARNTLYLGVTVSLMSLFCGAALALLAAQSRSGRWIDLLMSVPFLTPPFLASLAWSLAVGPKGYLGRFGLGGELFEKVLFSFWGLMLLMAVHYAPIVYFAVRAQIDKLSPSLLWAGRIAGANPRSIIGRILLPTIYPALLASGFLAFASGIEEYGTPLVIGNRIGFPVVSTEIGRAVSVYPINLNLASALASSLLAFAGAVYFFSYLLKRQVKTSGKPSSYPLPDLIPRGARTALWLFVLLYTLFTIVIPYGSMLLTSLLKLASAGPALSNLTLANYLHALTEDSSGLREALLASFSLALFAALIATMLGAAAARKSVALTSLALIPSATPAITMAVVLSAAGTRRGPIGCRFTAAP